MIHGGNVWQGASPAGWLDFSANLRPEGPPAWVFDVLRSAMDEVRYYPDLSMHAARRGIAMYAGVDPACVLPTAGGIAAIDLVCRAGTGRVVVNQPTFGEYARRAKACGRTVGSGEIRAGDLVFLCNPNNPTGTLLPRDEVLALARRNITLCVDEAFSDFCPAESVRDRAAAGELIVVGSLTKTLCVPGVRLGYLIASPKDIDRFAALAAPWSISAFATAIAREIPKYLDELREDKERNVRRRAALSEMLINCGAYVYPSRTNFLLADFKRPMGRIMERLQAEGILVRDCASFGLSDGHIRFAVRTEKENERLIRALERAIR